MITPTRVRFRPDIACAREMDGNDPLRDYRSLFYHPVLPQGRETMYLCGNSLGLQPQHTEEYMGQVLAAWKELGVEGHFQGEHPWIGYHDLLTGPMSEIVGAKPDEVAIMNSLTVNLHLMMVSFYRPSSRRYRIIMEANAFPSDRYAVVSQLRYHDIDPADGLLEIHPRPGEDTLRTEDIEEFISREGDTVALVLLGSVQYLTGQAFSIERITQAGHERGCMVGYDLAHAVGNIRLNLHEWDVDFAVWCSYKYLNGGPGAVAGCFVHERHGQDSKIRLFAGWWGHDRETRFLMGTEFDPIPGAKGWQISNSPIPLLAALRASLEIFDRAGMDILQTKSRDLTGFLEYLLDQKCAGHVSIITPRHVEERGAQLSIRVAGDGKRIHAGLNAQGVICDWREPDVIRLAPVPLYNSYEDVFRTVEILEGLLHEASTSGK
jgi:kynureninase